MGAPNVSFAVDRTDRDLITKIAERAYALARQFGARDRSPMAIEMDLTACHANGCPLRLIGLLNADEANLMHDISGIARHLNRQTGQLDGLFVPRFAQPEVRS